MLWSVLLEIEGTRKGQRLPEGEDEGAACVPVLAAQKDQLVLFAVQGRSIAVFVDAKPSLVS